MRLHTVPVTIEDSVEFLKSLERKLHCESVVPICSIYQDSPSFYRDTYLSMFCNSIDIIKETESV